MRFYYRDLIELTDLDPATILKYMKDSILNCTQKPAIEFKLDKEMVPYTTYNALRKWLAKKPACRVYLNLSIADDIAINSIYRLGKVMDASHDYISTMIERGYISLPATVSEIRDQLKKHPDVYMMLQIHKRDSESSVEEEE